MKEIIRELPDLSAISLEDQEIQTTNVFPNLSDLARVDAILRLSDIFVRKCSLDPDNKSDHIDCLSQTFEWLYAQGEGSIPVVNAPRCSEAENVFGFLGRNKTRKDCFDALSFKTVYEMSGQLEKNPLKLSLRLCFGRIITRLSVMSNGVYRLCFMISDWCFGDQFKPGFFFLKVKWTSDLRFRKIPQPAIRAARNLSYRFPKTGHLTNSVS